MTTLALILAVAGIAHAAHAPRSWASDNGNGTCANPLFYDEFSDPDMIRVGSGYYLTGTTVHAMPGLPILHSRDLVNWRWIAYGETFQWVDLQRGDTLQLSLATHRYVAVPKTPGPVSADHPGPSPDRKDGSCFQWKVAK